MDAWFVVMVNVVGLRQNGGGKRRGTRRNDTLMLGSLNDRQARSFREVSPMSLLRLLASEGRRTRLAR